MRVKRRILDSYRAVALETTLLAHGVPRESAWGLQERIAGAVRAGGGEPVLMGVLDGECVAGMGEEDLRCLLDGEWTPKLNTANLGLALECRLMGVMHCGATTISTTVEIAAAAGVSFMATGGLGGVHKGYGARWDVSADLLAIARHPVAVVCSGVKGLLDVAATREMLETLGVTVVGFRTAAFAAFYQREARRRVGGVEVRVDVDACFNEVGALARFVRAELARTGRGVVICNPIAEEFEIEAGQWERWLREAEGLVVAKHGEGGRDVTPAVLKALHEVSGGATLQANVELVVGNAGLAGALAGWGQPGNKA